jgi:hypothetical protein
MTMPSKPRRVETAEEPADCTLLQHWMGPVLHWLAGSGVDVAVWVTVIVVVLVAEVVGVLWGPPGVATARSGTATRPVKMVKALIANILVI